MDSPPQAAQQTAGAAASRNGSSPIAGEDASLMAARIAETARTVQAMNEQLAVLQLELGVLLALTLLALTLQGLKRRAGP